MKTLAIIPARSGSKGLRDKNILKIKGKTLIEWAVEGALNSQYIDKVVVSTDSESYAKIAKNCNAEIPFLRPSSISSDSSTAVDVIRHALSFYSTQNEQFENIIYLQPTSPLRTSQDLDRCLELLENYDDVVSVTKVPHNFLPGSLMYLSQNNLVRHYEKNEARTFNRHKKETKLFARNGPAIYAAKTNFIINKQPYSNKTGYYEMSKLHSIDIDDEIDFLLAELILDHLLGEANS